MSPLSIRQASIADAAMLAEYNVAMADETEDLRLELATVLHGVTGLLTNPADGFYLIAEYHGEAVGQLMITREWSDWRNGHFWWIQSVYVRPDARRQGIYRAMHQHVLTLARQADHVCGVRLYVHRTNTNAIDTYRTMGMEETHYRLFETVFT